MTEQWDGWLGDGPDFGDGDLDDPGLAHSDLDHGGDEIYPPDDSYLRGDYPESVDDDYRDGELTEEHGEPVEGFGPADDTTSGHVGGVTGYGDPPVEGFGSADTPVGADPDLGAYGEADPWPDPVVPGVELPDLGPPPEPVDGFPWIDPELLGGDTVDTPADHDPIVGCADAPPPDELAGYAGVDVPADADPWATLVASDDPATSALARFWGPGAA